MGTSESFYNFCKKAFTMGGVYSKNGGYEFVPFAYTGYKFVEFVPR
jgi:hypothetical protein